MVRFGPLLDRRYTDPLLSTSLHFSAPPRAGGSDSALAAALAVMHDVDVGGALELRLDRALKGSHFLVHGEEMQIDLAQSRQTSGPTPHRRPC